MTRPNVPVPTVLMNSRSAGEEIFSSTVTPGAETVLVGLCRLVVEVLLLVLLPWNCCILSIDPLICFE